MAQAHACVSSGDSGHNQQVHTTSAHLDAVLLGTCAVVRNSIVLCRKMFTQRTVFLSLCLFCSWQVHFIVNNLSTANLESKSRDLKDLLPKEFWPWFANYMVVKRAAQVGGHCGCSLHFSMCCSISDRLLGGMFQHLASAAALIHVAS